MNKHDILFYLIGIKVSKILSLSYKLSERTYRNYRRLTKLFNWDGVVEKEFLDEFSQVNSELNGKSDSPDILLIREIIDSLKMIPSFQYTFDKYCPEDDIPVESINIFNLASSGITDFMKNGYLSEIVERKLLDNTLVNEKTEDYVIDILLVVYICSALSLSREEKSFITYYLSDCLSTETPLSYFLNFIQEKIQGRNISTFIPRIRKEKVSKKDSLNDTNKRTLSKWRSEKDFPKKGDQYLKFAENIVNGTTFPTNKIDLLIVPYIYTKFILDQKEIGNKNYGQILKDLEQCEVFFKSYQP